MSRDIADLYGSSNRNDLNEVRDQMGTLLERLDSEIASEARANYAESFASGTDSGYAMRRWRLETETAIKDIIQARDSISINAPDHNESINRPETMQIEMPSANASTEADATADSDAQSHRTRPIESAPSNPGDAEKAPEDAMPTTMTSEVHALPDTLRFPMKGDLWPTQHASKESNPKTVRDRSLDVYRMMDSDEKETYDLFQAKIEAAREQAGFGESAIGWSPVKVTVDLGHSSIRELPESIVDLVAGQVEKLSLSHNQLWTLPHRFSECSRLRYLNIRSNGFTWMPQAVCNLPLLEILDIGWNKIKGVPEGLGKLTSLRVLSIVHNRVTDSPFELSELEKLKILKVGKNPLRHDLQEVIDLKEAQLLRVEMTEHACDEIITAEIKTYLRQRVHYWHNVQEDGDPNLDLESTPSRPGQGVNLDESGGLSGQPHEAALPQEFSTPTDVRVQARLSFEHVSLMNPDEVARDLLAQLKVADSERILQLMKLTCGRMHGILFFRPTSVAA